MTGSKIKSVTPLGRAKTYNLTMKSDQHNYALYPPGNDDRFVISANSHSLCYGYLSYITAYLKANYTPEFFAASLNVTNLGGKQDKFDKIGLLLKDMDHFDIVLGEKNINKCDTNFKIVKKKDEASNIDKTVISPSLMVKGVGAHAAEEIVKNKPYKSLKDLALKTSTSVVTKDVILSLAEAGFFGQRKKPNDVVEIFLAARRDRKEAEKRGIELYDMFEDN